MTREMKATVRHYFLLKAVSHVGISSISAFYVTFLIAKGLNLLEVNMVNFFFYTTLFIFEIPTGAFADVFGRKLSYVISCCLFSLGMFCYGLADSFWEFVLAECISAVGATFASGAFRAWLIDRLRHQGFKGPMTSIFAKQQQIDGIVGMSAAMIGAFLSDKSLSLPWFMGGIFFAIAACLAMAYMREEDEFVHHKFSFRLGLRSMGQTIKFSAGYASRHHAVRFILIATTIQWVAVQAPNMQWQPLFGQFVSSQTKLGFVYTSISLSIMAGAALAPIFLARIRDEKRAISITQTIIGLGICLTAVFDRLTPALTIFLVHEVARGMFIPLKDVYLNDNIPSKERATLISFDSIARHIGGMIGLIASGILAQYASMGTAWIISGTLLMATTIVLLKNGNKN